MKLASMENGRPDGRLVVVSADLGTCVSAGRIAPTLQAALDSWESAEPQLRALALQLEKGRVAGEPFVPAKALAPLPRAYQWIDGAAYLGHLERVRNLRNSGIGQIATDRPLMYQGASDSLCAGHAPIRAPDAELAVDFEAELAVILGPVPMGAARSAAAGSVRLIALCNDISFRKLVAEDLTHGFGFFHSKPATSFASVVVTPDELGAAWRFERAHVRVRVELNGKVFGDLDAGADMDFTFADLIVEAARTRQLGTGTILGSGTIANRHAENGARPRKTDGYACIAEARTAEKAALGKAVTPFLQHGDRVRIEAFDDRGRSLFGAIDQRVELNLS
ncbi:MAG: fumarylacetoacetate hydrolase family protein [Alphaproteobacteria bacterium]|nr:fumarylacetoacetate hydrolase family protein [Alphaproteobacteria bacterium]